MTHTTIKKIIIIMGLAISCKGFAAHEAEGHGNNSKMSPRHMARQRHAQIVLAKQKPYFELLYKKPASHVPSQQSAEILCEVDLFNRGISRKPTVFGSADYSEESTAAFSELSE